MLRSVGLFTVACLVGPKRAGKREIFETILGGFVIGAVIGGFLQATELHVFYSEITAPGFFGPNGTGRWEPMSTWAVASLGALIGLLSGAGLCILKKVLDDF